MSLNYSYRKATRLIRSLGPGERQAVLQVCQGIRRAQDRLCRAAQEDLTRCYQSCKGLCCRNLVMDTLISHWDLVYILLLAPELSGTLENCLERENRLFAADCLFLAQRTGPCLFPPGVRPEICIVSFCMETPRLDREIRLVKQAFFKLTWTMNRIRFLSMAGRILKSKP